MPAAVVPITCPRAGSCLAVRLRSSDCERAADRRRRTLSADDRSELRFESFDLGRQLDRWKQLGALGDDGGNGLGLVRREPAGADVVEQVGISEQSSGVFSGRMWNDTGAPRREGMTRSISEAS